MSNRVRILLIMPTPKFVAAFLGKRAVAKLSELYETSREVTYTVNVDADGKIFPVFHNFEASIPVLPSWKRAKWLWEHIPAPARHGMNLIVTREKRRFSWGRSDANPEVHGFSSIQKAKTPAPSAAQKTAAKVFYSQSLTQSFSQSLYHPEEPSFDEVVRNSSKRKRPKPPQNQEGPPEKQGLRVGIWS